MCAGCSLGKKLNHEGTKTTKKATRAARTLREILRVLRAFVVEFSFAAQGESFEGDRMLRLRRLSHDGSRA